MIDCKCIHWATIDGMSLFFGNGHNPRCEKFVPNVGAIKLLEKLVSGIDFWASQEDGIHDELWEAYKEAFYIVKGKFPEEKQE